MIIGIIGKKQSGKNTVASMLQYLLHCEKRQLTNSFEDYIFKCEKVEIVFEWEQKAFASKVKQFLSILTGIPIEDMEKEEVKNTYLGEEWTVYSLIRSNSRRELFFPSTKEEIKIHAANFKDSTIVEKRLTVREALQYIGTNLFRNRFNKNTWINALFTTYKKYTEVQVNMIFDRTLKKYVVPFGHGEHTGKTFSEGPYFSYDLDIPIYPNWIITDVRFPNEANAITDRGGFLIKVDRSATSSSKDLHESERSIGSIKTADYYLDNSFETAEELYNDVKENLFPFITKALNLKN